MGLRKRLSFAFGLGGVLAGAPTARADLSPVPQARLVWVRGEGADGCSDGAAIARRVSLRLGRSVFSDSALIRIDGVIQREGVQWHADLYLRGSDGHLEGVRHLTSDAPDCDALDAAATLAVALAIDPEAALRPPPSGAPPPPSPAPLPAAPPVVPAPSPSPPEAHPGREEVEVSLEALASFGLLPKTSAGLSLSISVEVARSVEVTAGALYLPEVHTADGDFAFGLTAGRAGACFVPVQAHRARLSLCGMGLLGAIHSVVLALEPVQPGELPWAAGALSAQLRVRAAGPVIFDVGGDAVAPVTRNRFLVENRPGMVFQEGPVVGTAFAGLGVEIP